MAGKGKLFFFVALCLLSERNFLFCAGQTAFPFLLIAPGARAAGLGSAFAGVARGPEGPAFNPAGLAGETSRQITFQHTFFVDGILYDNLLYVYPAGSGAWAAGAGFLHIKGLTRTVSDPASPDGFRELNDFSTSDISAQVHYGKRLNPVWSAGGGVKFVRESLSDAQALAGAFDLGILYRARTLPFTAGISVQNLGPSISYQSESFDLPALIRAGASFTRASASRWIPEGTLLSIEGTRRIASGEASASGGLEIPSPDKQIALRAGYHYPLKKQTLLSTFSLPSGFSLGLGILKPGWDLDYSVSSLGELGLAHRISLTFKGRS